MSRWVVCLLLSALSVQSSAADHAVVLLYHHVSEHTPATTSVTPEQFELHLDFLTTQGFVVLPLSEILDALYAGVAVPENAVALTFDDAWKSVYTEAWPVLRARQLPFTLFVATNDVDAGRSGFMSWQQMRAMDPALASFGSHSLSHAHLLPGEPAETREQWRSRVRQEIRGSAARIRQELGVPVDSFAYPYGEYDSILAAIVESEGLYGIAQHSGPVGPDVNPREIPRFPLAGPFTSLARLATAVRSRPLPVIRSGMDGEFVSLGALPSSFLLRLADRRIRPPELGCFSADGTRLDVVAEGDGYRIDLFPLRPGRNKVNCTAAGQEPGENYWYSRLWTVSAAPESEMSR